MLFGARRGQRPELYGNLGFGSLEAHSLMYYDCVMPTMRYIALKVIPLLVLVWMSFAVLGGAVYTVKHGTSGDSLAKTGMGLCAASVAILFSAGSRKVRPPARYKRYLPLNIGLCFSRVTPQGVSAPFVIPLAPLIQVFRI